MKKPIVLLLVCLLLVPLDLGAAGKLKVDRTQFDFGTIREGQNALVNFTVTNATAEKISIKEIRTFAACVESKPLPKRELAPGESLELSYVFESLGYGGVQVNKKIEIYYNETDVLKLSVKGTVLALEKYQAPIGELLYNFFVLVDIRSRKEYLEEHILGAIHVPNEDLAGWANIISKSLSDEIIIYLYSSDGKLSDAAVQTLRKKGFAQCVSLVGGLREWKNQHGNKLIVSGER